MPTIFACVVSRVAGSRTLSRISKSLISDVLKSTADLFMACDKLAVDSQQPNDFSS